MFTLTRGSITYQGPIYWSSKSVLKLFIFDDRVQKKPLKNNYTKDIDMNVQFPNLEV